MLNSLPSVLDINNKILYNINVKATAVISIVSAILAMMAVSIMAIAAEDGSVANIKNLEPGMSREIRDTEAGKIISDYSDLILLALNKADKQASEYGWGKRYKEEFEYGKIYAYYKDGGHNEHMITIFVDSLDRNEVDGMVGFSDDADWARNKAREYFSDN